MGGWRRTGVAVVALLVAVGIAPTGASGAQEQQPRTFNTEVVGHLAPPQDGGYGDVWAHKDVAYLGNLRQGDCRPANGIWAIDLEQPGQAAGAGGVRQVPGERRGGRLGRVDPDQGVQG